MEIFTQQNTIVKLNEKFDNPNFTSEHFGLIFNLSLLEIKRDNKDHIAIAKNILCDKLKSTAAELYIMDNNDFIIIHNNDRINIDEIVYQLRFLFAEDPLAYDSMGLDNSRFANIYNLSTEIENFKDACFNKTIIIEDHAEESISLLNFVASHLEDTLEKVDWNTVIQVNPIFVIFNNQPAQKIIEELNVNFTAIKQQLGQTFEVLKKSPLFSFLSEVFDLQALIKVLNLYNGNLKNIASSISLSIPTIQSDEFKSFNDALPVDGKENIVIGIHISEAYKNISEFFEVRNYLKEAGYKIALEGIDDISFLNIDRTILGVDLMKINFHPLVRAYIPEVERQLKEKIKISGSSRIIMNNCDSEKLFKLGQQLGISLYKGKYDLKSHAKVLNKDAA